MKMDFSKFKKISSDDKKTVMMHPRGHRIEIAHSGLSKEHVEGLKALKMSDGGEATSSHLHDDYSSDMKRQQVQDRYIGHPAPMNVQERKRLEHSVSERLGGRAVDLSMPTGMADGGEAGKELTLDLEGKNLPQAKVPLYQQPEIEQAAPYADQFGYQPPGAPQATSEQPVTNVQLPASAPAKPSPFSNNMAQDMSQQVSNIAQGQQQEAQAMAKYGQQEAVIARQHQNAEYEVAKHYERKSQEIDSERQAVYNDYKAGHLNPQHYMQSMSGFGKVMTGIGLLLGGISGGFTGGPNPVLEILHKNIDRDMDAQKAEMDKKQNLLSVLNQQFGNLKDATAMAKAMQADMYAAKIEEAGALAKSPIALARAKQAAAELRLKYEPQIQQMKINQALLSGSESGAVTPEVLVQRSPMVPDHQRPEMSKQLGKLRSLEELRDNMKESFNQIHSKTLNGAFSPNDVESAKQAFTGKLVQLSEGRYNYEAAQNLTNAMFPGKTDSSATASNKLVRLNSLIDSMAAEPRSMLEGVGIRVPKAANFTRREK